MLEIARYTFQLFAFKMCVYIFIVQYLQKEFLGKYLSILSIYKR